MRDRSFWSVSALATSASIVLASCGGDILAAVAFIGSAGGDWQIDGNAQPGLQLRSDCGAAGNEECTINISPVGGSPQDPFAKAFDVTYSGTMPGCAAVVGRTGRIDGKRISLPGCYTGEYVNANEALSDSGIRAFFDFRPDLEPGIWVEIQDGQRRFKFTDNTAGCEYTAPTRPAVVVSVVNSQVRDAAGPFETTIGSFAIGGAAAYSGVFVGVSGMSLRRGDEVLELERRNEAPSTPCP
jgi:hypothetical protein